MRIALLDWVCDPDRPGASGLSDIVWDLARHLRAIGEDAIVIGAYDRDAVRPEGSVPLIAVDRPRAWRRNIIGYGATCLALARAIRHAGSVDVVFCAEYISAPVAALYYPSLPVVFTTPGNIYERLAYSNPYDWSTTQVYKLAAKASVRYCHRVVAISQHMAEWWERTGAAPRQIVVVPHGTDTAVYYPRAGARARLGIPSEHKVVFYAGRLSVEKNLPTLMAAVAELAPSRPALHLYLGGTGPEDTALRRLAAELGIADRVQLVGWIDRQQMPDYYSAADVFALPTTNEALGRVLLEAMACGTMVVASSFAGPRDIVDDGVNGVLAAPTDARAWTRALAHALDDDAWRRQLADAGRRTVLERFDWPVIARRMRDEVFAPAARCAERVRLREAA